MDLAELPDFHAPLLGKGVRIYYPFSGGTRHFLMPDDLVVAERGDGSPDFLLEFVKVQAGSRYDAYGLLEFTVQAHFPMAEGLSALREAHPRGTLAPVPFAGGFLRLFPAGPVDTFPDELRETIPLAWNSLGSAPYVNRVRSDTAKMLKAALQVQSVLVHAYADLEVLGVSPRLPVRIEFSASALLDSLALLADAERRITRDALREYFLEVLKAPGTSPLSISGVVGDALGQQAFAETMADRVRESFATFVPAPDIGTDSYLQLASPAQFGSTRYTWDLSEPLAVHRPFSLYLDPLLTARALVQEKGEKGLKNVYQEVVPPDLKSGVMVVAVSANLPEQRPQVAELGAELYAPPNKTYQRPRALGESVPLTPPADHGTAVLRFSPKEPQRYQAQAYLVTAADNEKLCGRATTLDVPWVNLAPDDFPGRFILTSAGRDLLALATVHGVCTWTEGAAQKSQEFDLQADRSGAAVWLPDGAENAALDLEAREADGAGSLKLEVRPAASTSVDVYDFPQYGVQTLDIECAFDAGARRLGIDLLPEDRAETPENIVFQFFTPEEPRKQWTWVPRSLFRAGYRYRTHLGRDLSPWSDVRFATEPLRLRARAQVVGGRS